MDWVEHHPLGEDVKTIEQLLTISIQRLTSFQKKLIDSSWFKSTAIPDRINEIDASIKILESIKTMLKAHGRR
jgi:hypothetical protein